MKTSPFVKPMHPRRSIRPVPETISRILSAGWIAQTKIHGHRCQLHIPADHNTPILAYTRQGRLHTKELSSEMAAEIRRIFQPKRDWNVIDAEWYKPADKLYVFDILKKEGKTLRHLTFTERWKLLPKDYLSPRVSTLPVIRDQATCLRVMGSKHSYVEGLVFKSTTTPGFSDTSIIRCRKIS